LGENEFCSGQHQHLIAYQSVEEGSLFLVFIFSTMMITGDFCNISTTWVTDMGKSVVMNPCEILGNLTVPG